MKILYCTNFYTKTSGGVKTYINSVGEELLQRNLPFRLVVPGELDGIEESPDQDRRVYVIRSPRFPVNRDYRMILPFDFLPQFNFKLGRIIEREQPDVIEVSDLWTLIYMARALKERPVWYGLEKRPLVSGFVHDRLSDYMVHYFRKGPLRSGMLAFSSWYLKKIYLPCFDVLLANSEYTMLEIKKHMDARPLGKNPETRIVPLGVDVNTFHPSRRDDAFRDRILKNPDGFLLLYTGRLSKEKGLDRLLGAMRLLQDRGEKKIELLMVGDGALRSWVEGQGLSNTTILGHIGEREELARIYASADAFITPSIREGFGIAQLEAMAAGLPVICPDVAGQMSYMGKFAGLVTGSGEEELRDAALKMSRLSREERAEMSGTAREIALELSWSKTTDTILDIYREKLDILRNQGRIDRPEAVPACVAGAGEGTGRVQ